MQTFTNRKSATQQNHQTLANKGFAANLNDQKSFSPANSKCTQSFVYGYTNRKKQTQENKNSDLKESNFQRPDRGYSNKARRLTEPLTALSTAACRQPEPPSVGAIPHGPGLGGASPGGARSDRRRMDKHPGHGKPRARVSKGFPGAAAGRKPGTAAQRFARSVLAADLVDGLDQLGQRLFARRRVRLAGAQRFQCPVDGLVDAVPVRRRARLEAGFRGVPGEF